MMIANYGPRAMPTLQGLAGTAEIVKLQQSLVNLAQSTGKPQFTPGRTDGVLDDATMVAVASAFGVAANELPSVVSTALQLALIGGATTSTAKGYVGSYASQLSIAFNAAALKYKTTPSVPIIVPGVSPAAAPWYTTWWGLGGLIIGGIVVAKFMFAPRPTAQ